MPCIQANWVVPASNSAATMGAPRNNPARTGVASKVRLMKPTVGPPENNPPPVEQFTPAGPLRAPGAHSVMMVWYCETSCRPVSTSSRQSAATMAVPTANWARY